MEQQDAEALYQAHEFAKRAGVTVRALHHYDRLGLLKPSRRTARGYRQYTDADLILLEQIIVLKFLGLPLKQIRDVLRQETALPEVLARQQIVLARRRNQLDRAIKAIGKAKSLLDQGNSAVWQTFTDIIKEIEMQDTDWMMKYYKGEAREKVEARKALWSPELQERVSREWAELYRDVASSLHENPAGDKAQALGAGWKKLVDEFTGGDPQIVAGLKSLYADRDNWPEQAQQYMPPRTEAQQFIEKVFAAHDEK